MEPVGTRFAVVNISDFAWEGCQSVKLFFKLFGLVAKKQTHLSYNVWIHSVQCLVVDSSSAIPSEQTERTNVEV